MSSESDFKLTITPLKPSTVPSEESIIAAAQRLIQSTSSWKPGKTFKNVSTYHRAKAPEDRAPWHCRVSEHTAQEASFDQLWAKLGTDKATNEKEFIPEVKKVTKVKDLSSTASIWTMYYTFPPPVSPRVFTVLQVVHFNETSPRTGIIVSIPVDLASPGDEDLAKLEEKGVRGRYVSVERIRELEDGRTEWRMATSSTPGGSIPTFIVESTMASKISQDVPHFMKWLHATSK